MRQEERERARALVADKAVTEVHFGGVSAERWGPEGEAVWYVVDRRYKTAAGLTACRTSMRMDAVTAVVWARRISKVDAFGRDAAWSVLWETPMNKLVVEDADEPEFRWAGVLPKHEFAPSTLAERTRKVACPVCKAAVGEPCRGKSGHIEGHHADRSGAAKRAGHVRMTKGIR